jgi:predicted dehydrogenase
MTPGPALRLGLVGFGRLGRQYYVPALRALDGVSVAAVVDPLDASREAAQAMFPGAAIMAGPDALFSRQLDGCIVASPPSTHLALWNMAAQAAVPVLLEKPFALRGQLAQAASGSRERPLLMLDLNRRFWPPYRRIRDRTVAGLLGELRLVEIRLHVDIAPWCMVTSHRLLAGEGGVLYDLGSQAIDLARWLTGQEPQQVSASSRTHRWSDDHVLIELGFEGGLQARCDLAYSERAFERVVVEGQCGTLCIRDPNMAIHSSGLQAGHPGHRLTSTVRDLATLCYRGLRRSHSMMRFSVAAAVAAFVDSIRRGAPFSPGFEDAAADTAWLDAAARSIELGVPVARDGRSLASREYV